MPQRLTIEAMKVLALSKGGHCLSDSYKNANTPLTWKCSNEHIFISKPANIRNNGHWCSKCSGKARGTIEEMQEVASQRGGECLSDKYVNRYTKLLWRCQKGHTWEASSNHVKLSQSWCPACAGTKKLTLETMEVMAQEKGGLCLSEHYVNQKTKLEWQCADGHKFFMAPGNIRSQGQWCLKCNGYEKGTIEEMKQVAISRGGECLSTEYKNKETRLKWKCTHGHEWLARPGCVKRGSWCKECSRGFGERICRSYFESIFGKSFPSIKPKWLRNSRGNLMELDGFCEELNLAFEYQGHQHYLQTHFHKNEQDFETRKADDKMKKHICLERGVRLVAVPYTVKYDEMHKFVIDECEKQFVFIPEHIEKSLDEINPYFAPKKIDEMRSIADTRGGQCLSDKYLGNHEKLEWVCGNGHRWQAQPYSVKAGHWCPDCAGKRRLTMSEMQEIASERGGVCLSKEYKGNKAHLSWECSEGHIWSAIPNSIKRGRWCPVCALNKTRSSLSLIAPSMATY